ncbi:MAG: glycosyl hydrolase 115 family protein [Ignavibacteriaceae bacterium]
MRRRISFRHAALKLFILCFFIAGITYANGKLSYVSAEKGEGKFVLSEAGLSAPLLASTQDYPGVIRVLKHLQNDITTVTGAKPELITDNMPAAKGIVIVGTLGKSPLIDKLVQDKKINVDDIKGKWETFVIEVVENPAEGVDRALVIAGSDKRGTIFGIYDLSTGIGISPWHFWADVPAKKQESIYINPGRYSMGEPKVKYRGIFINDEAPALSGWSQARYGTVQFNHELYEHVFDLILRLKGNFLWPAMWGRAFYDDDPVNPVLADEYGVVISTSHHEPMMRAHVEWQRYGSGPWNYATNEETLRKFWREGIERMGDNESIVTLAMRGDGDEAMSSDANVELLEKIVKDQREIIKEVTGKDIKSVPQVWALYKEVQEYYDKGMRVPEDVTILLCDDNWGNIRKLPKAGEKIHEGGYGIYYHYDFVGGPRNYKWINTNQIERTWEQMHLAYEYGAREIWLVNVGDLKPMEFPIEFFLDYAWDPEAITAEKLPEYYTNWAEEQFGEKYAKDAGEIIAAYTKFNSRRKPEMLSPETYSLANYQEAETVVTEYKALEEKARNIYNSVPAEYKDAFYQLVLHPVEASANLNELYVTVAKNHLYAEQGRALTNALAEKAKALFKRDADITDYYNTELADGKWNHMMDQTHIGYTSWQEPPENVMPGVKEISLPGNADMGIAVEGSLKWWPEDSSEAVLPGFDLYNRQSYYLEIFNRGETPFKYSVKTGEPWVKVNKSEGTVKDEERLWVSIDWQNAPAGIHRIPITVSGTEKSVMVLAEVNNTAAEPGKISGFIESNGYVSIEAEHFSNAVNSSDVTWTVIPNIGRTLSGVTILPTTTPEQVPGSESSPRLEYKMHLNTAGEVTVKAYLSPTLNFKNGKGLHYAVSFDNEEPLFVNINEADTIPDWEYPQWWNDAVSNNIRTITSKHTIKEAGEHTLKFWAVDGGIVLQKIVIETGEVKPSYLGPPESFNNAVKTNIGRVD